MKCTHFVPVNSCSMGGDHSVLSKSVLNQSVMGETVDICRCDNERKQRSSKKPDLEDKRTEQTSNPQEIRYQCTQNKYNLIERRSVEIIDSHVISQVRPRNYAQPHVEIYVGHFCSEARPPDRQPSKFKCSTQRCGINSLKSCFQTCR